MSVRVVASVLLAAAVLCGGYLTRSRYLGTATSFDAALPSDISQVPTRENCATWYLDSAVDTTTHGVLTQADATIAIPRGHALELRGWAFIAGTRSYPRAMYWSWDDGSDRIALYPLKRDDVARKNADPTALFSGFFVDLDTRHEFRGRRVLAFRILDHDGMSACRADHALTVELR